MMAEPVSPEAARQAAAKFLNKKGIALKSEAMRAKNRAMGRNTDSEEQTQASPYYVFNATASQGFVVVSGDDCVGDNLVLGYTSQGSFDAEGGYDPVVFPSQPNIYTNLQLNSNMWRAVSIRLSEALETGEYGIDLLIANDFHSRTADDYFVFASGPLAVTSTTGIRSIENEELRIENSTDAWYDLNGRRLSGKPTAKGIYIHKGKVHIVK
jgi:hypothetical protein